MSDLSRTRQPANLDMFGHQPETNLTAGDLLAAWVSKLGHRPSDHDMKKQGAAAKRLVERHADDELLFAMVGITRLFPHSQGEPWDLFDLERKFPKALSKGRGHPDLVWQAERTRFMQATSG